MWRPDPESKHELRYHDGQQWTEHVSDHGTASIDPTGPQPAAPTIGAPVHPQGLPDTRSLGNPPQGGYPGYGPPPKKSNAGKIILFVLLGLVLLCGAGGLLVVVAGGKAVNDAANEVATKNSVVAPGASVKGGTQPTLFPNRGDRKAGDIEKNIGESVEASGYTLTVNKAGFQQQISNFENKGYMLITVSIVNRDSKAQSYNPFNWKLLTPTGTIIDPCFCSTPNELESGDLAQGGSVSGNIPWETGPTKGDYYVIWDDPGFSSERGIWKVTI